MSVNADSPANRLKSYKNKALDSQELRRRREEEGIQLRKQKRDEQVNTIFTMLANESILIQLAVYLYDCENNWPNFCTIRDVYTNGKGNFYIRRVFFPKYREP